MNRIRQDHEPRSGVALFTVMLVIFASSAFAATLVVASMQRAFTARRLANRVRAWAIAEAGAAEAYSLLQYHFDERTNPAAFPPTSYGDGVYDVTVTPVTNNVAVISSRAVCGKEVAVVVVDTVNTGLGSPGWDAEAFDCAMLAGGSFVFRGCGDIVSTNGENPVLHSNSALDLRGSVQTDVDIASSVGIRISNNQTIDGDVTAPRLLYNPSKVTITGSAVEQPVPRVNVPDIDLTPYYNWADDHGEIHNGFNLNSGTYDANGGVIWVNGDVVISGGAVVNGSIIATGTIKLSGSADINASEYGIAVASRDGSIDNQSSGTISGLVYAKTGGYAHTANGYLDGQVIAKGDILKAGSSDVLMFNRIIPTYPGLETVSELVGVSAWQK